MEGFDNFTTLNINDIETAYRNIRGNMAIEAMYAVVAGIMIITFLVELVNEYKKIENNPEGVPKMKDFMSMVKQCAFTILVIALFPTLLSLLENIFGDIMTAMQTKFGTQRYDMYSLLNKAIKADWEQVSNENLLQTIISLPERGFQYIMSFVVSSIIAPFYLHASTLFIAGRYMILLMLEMLSPIAIACFYNDKLRHHFFSWVRNLLICYLMVPAFILASQFCDEIVIQFIINPNPLIPHTLVLQIIYALVLKLSLLAIVRNRIYNLL